MKLDKLWYHMLVVFRLFVGNLIIHYINVGMFVSSYRDIIIPLLWRLWKYRGYDALPELWQEIFFFNVITHLELLFKMVLKIMKELLTHFDTKCKIFMKCKNIWKYKGGLLKLCFLILRRKKLDISCYMCLVYANNNCCIQTLCLLIIMW